MRQCSRGDGHGHVVSGLLLAEKTIERATTAQSDPRYAYTHQRNQQSRYTVQLSPYPRIKRAKGSRKTARVSGCNRLRFPGGFDNERFVDAPGTWIDKDTSCSEALAGKDHDVLFTSVQNAVASVAVAPLGRPVTVNRVAVGKVDPAVGAIAMLKLAVPPGTTVWVVCPSCRRRPHRHCFHRHYPR